MPSNIGPCPASNASATGVGSCGDKLAVHLCVDREVIDKIACQPQGCLYTVACASAMSVLADGRTLEGALSLQPEDVVEELEGLPEDHLHCARLAINTLGEAIADFYRRAATGRSVEADVVDEKGDSTDHANL